MNELTKLSNLEEENLGFEDESHYGLGFGTSTVLHLIIVAGSFIIGNQLTSDLPAGIPALQFEVENFEQSFENPDQQKHDADDKNELNEKIKEIGQEKIENTDFAATFNSNFQNVDTTSLQQIYSENTLNVRVRYPLGWRFVDQNVKNKLDGVTFFGAGSKDSPPPYIHIEVKEKYLFNPGRYLFNVKINNYVAYFNEPTSLEEQYTQTLYIRTEGEEDYSIKLIVSGKEKFLEYQKIFFSMIKSFKFGGFF